MTEEAATPTQGRDVIELNGGAGALSVERDFGPEMSMDDYVGWFTENFGTSSVRKAMEQAAFMLCVDVISQDIAKATLRLRRWLPNGTSVVVKPEEHAMAEMLALDPNRRHTWYEYKEMMTMWSCLESNAIAVIIRDRLGDPLELIPVQPGRSREYVNGRDIFYEITASTMQEQALLGASRIRVPERDIIHIRGRMLDGMDGTSTVSLGSKTINLGSAMADSQKLLWDEDGQIRGVFTRDGDTVLPEDAFNRLRTQFKAMMSKFRSLTEPIVLEGGLKFDAISSNPQELEFTKQFQQHVNDTCRLLRVPPHKVFLMDGSKYDNLETSEKIYVGDTLIPRCLPAEQRMARQLLSKKDRLLYFFEHDRDEMTLRDSQRENERLQKMIQAGVLEIDEARAEMGYNPLPNGQGQTRTIPTQMTVVDRKGTVLLGGASTAADDTGAPAEAEPEVEPAKGLRLVESR